MARTRSFDVYNIIAESPIHTRENAEAILSLGDPEAASQPVWFIDPVGGDDNNPGQTALTAIRTEQEAIRRIGNQIVNVAMTWNLMNDFPVTNPFYADETFQFGSSGSLTVTGAKPFTTLYSGVFTAPCVDSVAATNIPNQVSDAGIPVSWAALGAIATNVGTPVRVRVTSGPNAGAIFYITAEPAARTARISKPVIPPTFSTLQTAVLPSALVGESYVVETGYVQISNIRFQPGGTGLVQPFPTLQRLFFEKVALRAGTGFAPIVGMMDGSDVRFSQSAVGTLKIPYQNNDTLCIASLVGNNGLDYGTLIMSQCAVLGTIAAFPGALLSILGDTIFDQNGTLIVEGTALIERACIFGWSGGTNDALVVRPGGVVRNIDISPFGPHALYGAGTAGNSRAGINCFGTANFSYQTTKPTLAGSSADTRIQGVNRAYAFVPHMSVYNHELRAGFTGLVPASPVFPLPNLVAALADEYQQVLDRSVVLQNLRVFARVAPGAGVTDTITVLLDGAPTIITTSLVEGSPANFDVTNRVVATPGQRVSFQLTTVGGVSATRDLSIVLEANNNNVESVGGITIGGSTTASIFSGG